MVTVAFYRGKGLIGNALIRWWTRSPLSHCEVVIGSKGYSSSLMDHGVRAKAIDWNPAHWDFVQVPWASERDVLELFSLTEGESYSWLDLIRSQLFNHRDDEAKKSFCSEWCARALGLPDATSYSPASLKVALEFINLIYAAALAA